MKVRLSELEAMTEEGRKEALDAIAEPPDADSSLHEQVTVLEDRYGMSSAEMKEKLATGEMKETPEISK